MNERPTPETDSLEARIESEGKRDVPVRVYQEMRRLERQRDELVEVLRDIEQHASHATKHGVAELALASIRDKADAALAGGK